MYADFIFPNFKQRGIIMADSFSVTRRFLTIKIIHVVSLATAITPFVNHKL